VLFILGVLTFKVQWLLIVSVALGLNLANVIGYTKCDKGMADKALRIMSKALADAVAKAKDQAGSLMARGALQVRAGLPLLLACCLFAPSRGIARQNLF
jgi:hypothetical protein